MARAIVTGAVGGIGSAICRRLAVDGHHVGVLDLDGDRVERAAAELPGAVPLVADITDEAAVDDALDTFGPADWLVNNAGIVRFGPLLEHAAADFAEVLRVNLHGTFLMSRAAARSMVERGTGGAIVTVTSVNGIVPGPYSGAYGPSKAGLALLVQEMALEWGAHGIRVNGVAPGLVEGGMSTEIHTDVGLRARREAAIPLRRLCRESDVADVVEFLLSDRAAYVSGQNLVVDGALLTSVLATLPRPRRVDGVGEDDPGAVWPN